MVNIIKKIKLAFHSLEVSRRRWLIDFLLEHWEVEKEIPFTTLLLKVEDLEESPYDNYESISPQLSQDLNKMLKAGIFSRRKEGRKSFYKLNQTNYSNIKNFIQQWES